MFERPCTPTRMRMTIRRTTGIVALCIFVTFSGCHVSTAPTTIVRYNPQLPPSVIKATYHGQYLLYAMSGRMTAPPAGAQPIASRRLTPGDRVGFLRDANGTVLAVAGADAVPIAQQHHLWQMRADPGQIDKAKTNAVVTTTVLIVVIAALTAGTAFIAFGS